MFYYTAAIKHPRYTGGSALFGVALRAVAPGFAAKCQSTFAKG
jgi:hypothetical protein